MSPLKFDIEELENKGIIEEIDLFLTNKIEISTKNDMLLLFFMT